MAEFPALPLWTDALIGDTFHLTPAEFGAYLRLLICAWRTPECALPADDARLGRMIGDPKNWHRLKPTVIAFFHIGDDGLFRQKRLSDERDFVSRSAAKFSAGVRAKALKRKNRGSACAVPNECLNAAPTPTPTPTPKEESISSPKPAKVRVKSVLNGHADDFLKFYSAYPRHVGRRAAEKAYAAAITRGEIPVILAGAMRYAEAVKGKEPQYIAHPATWLNADRWLDETAPQAKNVLHIDQAIRDQQAAGIERLKQLGKIPA